MRILMILGSLFLAGCDCEDDEKVDSNEGVIEKMSLLPGEEVRCYDLGLALFEMTGLNNRHVSGDERDPFAADPEPDPENPFELATGVDWLGPVVTEVGF